MGLKLPGLCCKDSMVDTSWLTVGPEKSSVCKWGFTLS